MIDARTKRLSWLRHAGVDWRGNSEAQFHAEKMSDYPLYANGPFAVIESVAGGLEFMVLRVVDSGMLSICRVVPLDKYEAIKVADEFRDALDRSDALEEHHE